jgi:hypothetical protein
MPYVTGEAEASSGTSGKKSPATSAQSAQMRYLGMCARCLLDGTCACLMRAMCSGVLTLLMLLSRFFVQHCTWVTSEAYSSPSIVLASRTHDGCVLECARCTSVTWCVTRRSRRIFDDFRESYRWINQNTAADARIMS